MIEKTKQPFNRLILLGNGFDLAHGLKTGYNDFILWYLTRVMYHASIHRFYEDELVKVIYPDFYGLNYLHNQKLHEVPAFLNFFYERGLSTLLTTDYFKVPGWGNDFKNPFQFKFHSDLLLKLINECSHANWVDIENTFYQELKHILKFSSNEEKPSHIAGLNSSLKIIIDNLETYLSSLDVSAKTTNYESILFSGFDADEFVGLTNEQYWNSEIDQTMILNFNYTSTVENYLDPDNADPLKLDVNYIHGKIGDDDNRPIFGFGDELDSDYSSFELDKTKGIFEYIKSFWYFRTSNYHNLIRFIDAENFQVFILGHSCGLSDRTMLNMIFEHENCKSIKIFYHQQGETNDYTKLTQEISRHFRDKQQMRRKIVPFNLSSHMPQVVL